MERPQGHNQTKWTQLKCAHQLSWIQEQNGPVLSASRLENKPKFCEQQQQKYKSPHVKSLKNLVRGSYKLSEGKNGLRSPHTL